MRLAFDKPTVIIKDDKTDYMFDTGIIEHVGYPRDLRYSQVVAFKSNLAAKVLATYKAALADPDHSTFLRNFGKFQIATLNQDVVPADKLVVKMLADIQDEIVEMRRRFGSPNRRMKKDEAIMSLVRAFVQWRIKNPEVSVNSQLLKDEAFVEHIEDECGARQLFERKAQFVEALADVVRAHEVEG
jgi:hypothetical protein